MGGWVYTYIYIYIYIYVYVCNIIYIQMCFFVRLPALSPRFAFPRLSPAWHRASSAAAWRFRRRAQNLAKPSHSSPKEFLETNRKFHRTPLIFFDVCGYLANQLQRRGEWNPLLQKGLPKNEMVQGGFPITEVGINPLIPQPRTTGNSMGNP